MAGPGKQEPLSPLNESNYVVKNLSFFSAGQGAISVPNLALGKELF